MKLSRYRHICLAGYLSILSCSFLLPMLAHASTEPPITLVATTPLPEIVGDFDHFAVDLKRIIYSSLQKSITQSSSSISSPGSISKALAVCRRRIHSSLFPRKMNSLSAMVELLRASFSPAMISTRPEEYPSQAVLIQPSTILTQRSST